MAGSDDIMNREQSKPMRLKDLLAPINGTIQPDSDVEISGIAYDSRAVTPGALFVAFRGGTFDGHTFIADALKRGAAAIIAEKDTHPGVPMVLVKDAREVLPLLSAKFYDYPAKKLAMIGITGTNGKTTTSYLMQSILRSSGKKVGLIGTLGARINDEPIETEHTTPESADLQRVLAMMVDQGVDAVAMEVSSHGLAQGRTSFCEFDCGVFTNLTQDHLDFHGTMDDYLTAKLKLFSEYPLASDKKFVGVVNMDDPYGVSVSKSTNGKVITYGITSDADVKGSDVIVTSSTVTLVITYQGKSEQVTIPIGGYFNAYNGLASCAACLAMGLDFATVIGGLKSVPSVAGRFESVDCGQNFGVIVDYAHTPDGLENVLRTARNLAKNRLIVVFGCGGKRDRTKRPIMGKIGSELADIAIITSDNPRNEDPSLIIKDILEGVQMSSKIEAILDRHEAIERGIMLAQKGDVVVIAGKGHEDYQIFADETIHFDDREVARDVLARRLSGEDE